MGYEILNHARDITSIKSSSDLSYRLKSATSSNIFWLFLIKKIISLVLLGYEIILSHYRRYKPRCPSGSNSSYRMRARAMSVNYVALAGTR